MFKNISGVIFDCDGVLVNSSASNRAYYNGILAFFGIPPLTPEEEEYAFMATVDQALQRFLPAPLHARLDEAKKSLDYTGLIMPLIKLEDGLLDFLRLLMSKDIARGIHTNRTTGMKKIMDLFDLHPYFDPVITADMGITPKPDPAGVVHILGKWNIRPERALFIGDSTGDALTAKNAGVNFVAFGNKKIVSDIHMSSFMELSRAFQRDFP